MNVLAELLDQVEHTLTRYVAFPSEDARVAVTLWIAHAHAADAFESTPRLALLSPEKGSGKTRTLEVLALLVPKPLHAVNISVAALYRVVADRQPTLLLDEADTYLGNLVVKQHEDLRGLINAGHRRGATVARVEMQGKVGKVVDFPAYAACALAGLGDLPDTILDRSIIISMKRRAPNEHVEAFRERLARPAGDIIRTALTDWADAHLEQLRDAWPAMPDGITDRAADVWEPLLAIADEAGRDWPIRARAAAVRLNQERVQRDPSLGAQLLADIHRIYTAQETDRLTSADLVKALAGLDESPWGDLRGKPLDERGLARRLRKYDIRPAPHRFTDGVHKGYRAESFHDAWQRYLPADTPPVTDVTDVTVSQRVGGAEATPTPLFTLANNNTPSPPHTPHSGYNGYTVTDVTDEVTDEPGPRTPIQVADDWDADAPGPNKEAA